MKILGLRTVVLVLITVMCFGCVHNKKRQEEVRRANISYNTGVGYLRQGLYDQALPYFIESDSLDPGNPLVLNALGLIYLGQGKAQAAANEFQRAIKLSDLADFHNNLANAYLLLQEYEKAVEECDRALADRAYQTPSFAYFNKGMALLKLHRESEAIEALKLAGERDPNGDRPYYELGVIYLRQGNAAEALANLKIAKRNNPNFLDTGYQLAMAYIHSNNQTEACKELRTVIANSSETQPIHAQARALLMQYCEGN